MLVFFCYVYGDHRDRHVLTHSCPTRLPSDSARISVEVKNGPGALGVLATIIGAQRANIINLRLDTRDTTFHTNTIDLEVHDAAHLMRVLAALRAADAVAKAERM